MSLTENYWNSLNIDKNRPYHYLIGVCVHSAQSGKNAGKLYLKYGPVKFTNHDIANVRDALRMANDGWIKVDQSQALKNFGCRDLVCMISAMLYSLRANMGTLHHFSSEFELENEFFEKMVKRANNSKHDRDLLSRSEVGRKK